jgi:hypothetical protein
MAVFAVGEDRNAEGSAVTSAIPPRQRMSNPDHSAATICRKSAALRKPALKQSRIAPGPLIKTEQPVARQNPKLCFITALLNGHFIGDRECCAPAFREGKAPCKNPGRCLTTSTFTSIARRARNVMPT